MCSSDLLGGKEAEEEPEEPGGGSVPAKSTYKFVIPKNVELTVVDECPTEISLNVTSDQDEKEELADLMEVDNLDAYKVTVGIKTTKVGQSGYEHVRLDKLEVEGLESGATLKVWTYAKGWGDGAGAWFDITNQGWGPADGYEQPRNDKMEMDFYVFADTAGIYNVTFKLIDLDNDNATIVDSTIVYDRLEFPKIIKEVSPKKS